MPEEERPRWAILLDELLEKLEEEDGETRNKSRAGSHDTPKPNLAPANNHQGGDW